MQACSNRMEILMMDVHGELDPGDRVDWEHHLETCQGCRRERDRMLNTIREMKEAMKVPELPPERAEALISALRREVGGASKGHWWRKTFFGERVGMIPALATACILFVILGFYGYRMLMVPTELQFVRDHSGVGQSMQQDFDVIANLELLRSMDAIEKLVTIVDDKKGRGPADEKRQDTHGMIGNEYEESYA